MRSFWIIFFSVAVVFGVTCGVSYFAIGSGNGDNVSPLKETTTERKPDTIPPSEFHAWVEHPEHIFDPNLMRVSIRLFPDANTFPGLGSADVNRLDDMIVQATVRVDVSVPLWNAQIANRPQSHIQRERARGREALEFCRRAILNASGLLVVAPRYEENDRLVHCRVVLIDDAGDRVDLGQLLVKNGFAAVKDVDWGQRVPR